MSRQQKEIIFWGSDLTMRRLEEGKYANIYKYTQKTAFRTYEHLNEVAYVSSVRINQTQRSDSSLLETQIV